MKKDFKPLTIDAFNLTPEEKETLVKGAQRFLPPYDESGEPLPTEPSKHASRPEHSSRPKSR